VALHVEVEQEEDGRWLAEVPELSGVMAYGHSRQNAIDRAEALAPRVIADRLDHGRTPSSSAVMRSGRPAIIEITPSQAGCDASADHCQCDIRHQRPLHNPQATPGKQAQTQTKQPDSYRILSRPPVCRRTSCRGGYGCRRTGPRLDGMISGQEEQPQADVRQHRAQAQVEAETLQRVQTLADKQMRAHAGQHAAGHAQVNSSFTRSAGKSP
jgi:predicted RNase H-like HicB family nuclease